ncbi:hypothetical protein KHU50_012288 [Colletotrichum sp. SAR 10_65]|nr:hypothetical protein KHU50_012288 [Colletotrichum sp. SAR 10_65]
MMDLLGRRDMEPPTASVDINKPIPLEDRVVLAVPTPAALFGRQDSFNPIDQINQASRSAQQAIASASQSAAQAIQQANDQANDAATRASISANNAVVQAQASAREGIANAQQQARESASRDIAANLASVTSSANQQLASQIASIQASASISAAQAIASATASASAAIQSAQQQAQQQIQAARDDANLRVSQAQGAAVSVTQAALAVVGAIIGSSLLTILGFYIWTRYRRGKRKEAKERELRREISYPKQNTLMTTNALAANNGYPPDLKRSISPTRPDTARTTGSGGMGYAVSDFGDGAPNFSRTTTFVSQSAPQMQTIQREPSEQPPGTGGSQGPPPPFASATNTNPFASTNNEKLSKVDEEGELVEGSKGWLRRTQTVSPFGDLVDSPTGEKGSDWPFRRSDSPPPK